MNECQFTSRREFLKTSSTAAAGAALATTLAAPRPGYCAEENAIKIALVGCGGRGTGAAANALATAGPTKLWAVADVFPQKPIESRLAPTRVIRIIPRTYEQERSGDGGGQRRRSSGGARFD